VNVEMQPFLECLRQHRMSGVVGVDVGVARLGAAHVSPVADVGDAHRRCLTVERTGQAPFGDVKERLHFHTFAPYRW
jgi:hypothetical protein